MEVCFFKEKKVFVVKTDHSPWFLVVEGIYEKAASV